MRRRDCRRDRYLFVPTTAAAYLVEFAAAQAGTDAAREETSVVVGLMHGAGAVFPLGGGFHPIPKPPATHTCLYLAGRRIALPRLKRRYFEWGYDAGQTFQESGLVQGTLPRGDLVHWPFATSWQHNNSVAFRSDADIQRAALTAPDLRVRALNCLERRASLLPQCFHGPDENMSAKSNRPLTF